MQQIREDCIHARIHFLLLSKLNRTVHIHHLIHKMHDAWVCANPRCKCFKPGYAEAMTWANQQPKKLVIYNARNGDRACNNCQNSNDWTLRACPICSTRFGELEPPKSKPIEIALPDVPIIPDPPLLSPQFSAGPLPSPREELPDALSQAMIPCEICTALNPSDALQCIVCTIYLDRDPHL